MRSLPDQRLLPPGCPAGETRCPDQRLEQAPDLGRILINSRAADVVQLAFAVVEPEQQMFHRLGGALSIEAGNDAVDGLPELELPHGPLAGQVGQVEPLGDDAIEPLSTEPASGDRFGFGRLSETDHRNRFRLATKASSARRRAISG